MKKYFYLRQNFLFLFIAILFLTTRGNGQCGTATPVQNVNTGLWYATIQMAISDPITLPGHTISVCPGIYPENVTLGKMLNILGAKSGVDARGRVVGAPNPLVESIISPAAGACLELMAGSSGSTIDGFAMLGNVSGVNGVIQTLTSTLTTVQLRNNLLQATSLTGQALWFNRGIVDATIDRNEMIAANAAQVVFLNGPQLFHGMHFTNNTVMRSGAPAGTGIFYDASARNMNNSVAGLGRDPLIQGNLFKGHNTGINIGSRSLENGHVIDNTFMNNAFDGFQGGPKNTEIRGNAFKNNGRSGLALTSFGNSVDPVRGAQGCMVICNLFTGNFQEAIFLSASQFPGYIGTNTVNNNNISGNTVGLTYNGTEPINAELNWWGSATGPTIASNPGGTGDAIVNPSGSVDYSPFLGLQSVCAPCVQSLFYRDMDGDGYGDEANGTTMACSTPPGYSSTNDDCDDGNPAIHPGASEVCNGIDDDCDGTTDNVVLPVVSFDLTPGGHAANINNGSADATESVSVTLCDGQSYALSNLLHSSNANRYDISVTTSGGTMKFNGSAAGNGDIDAASFSGAQGNYIVTLDDPNTGGSVYQVITPYLDANGNNQLDPADCKGDPITITYTASPKPAWYQDADNDGHAGQSVRSCTMPSGTGWTQTPSPVDDCNDSDDAIYTGADEVCDGKDNDCDGLTDDADPDIIGQTTWFRDYDGDGYGNPGNSVESCNQPPGYVDNNYDCDDNNTKKKEQVLMCKDGKEKCVKPEDIVKHQNQGYVLGPCANPCKGDKVLMCHNGKIHCVKPKDVNKHLAKGWTLGRCMEPLRIAGRGESVEITIIDEFKLTASPNPLGSTTTIRYELPVDSKINITLYDPMGRVVATLVDVSRAAGNYNYVLDASRLAAGLYYYKMTAVSGEQKFVQTQKLMIVK